MKNGTHTKQFWRDSKKALFFLHCLLIWIKLQIDTALKRLLMDRKQFIIMLKCVSKLDNWNDRCLHSSMATFLVTKSVKSQMVYLSRHYLPQFKANRLRKIQNINCDMDGTNLKLRPTSKNWLLYNVDWSEYVTEGTMFRDFEFSKPNILSKLF